MREARREYLRDFAMTILHRASGPLTAGEVIEQLAVLAMTEGHDQKWWRSCDAPAMYGHLRALESDMLVWKSGTKPDGRAGRTSPAYEPMGARDPSRPIPLPPEEAEATPPAVPAPASPYEGHDRRQLLALLDHSDEVMGAVARFVGDLRDINRRHRQRFVDLGITEA